MLENRAVIGHQAWYYAKRILPWLIALLLGMIALGLLITKALDDVWPFTAEDGINRWFAAHRTDPLNAVTYIGSLFGSTPVIVGLTAIIAFILLRTLHSWYEPLFLCAAVSAQAIVFFFTTLVIDRQRPMVKHLDNSPPTSSFPSGHTSAAFALYCGLALVLAGLVHRTWQKWLCWALLLMPFYVALSRLYRGMHHPSDVTASFINGALCVMLMSWAILHSELRSGSRRSSSRRSGSLRSAARPSSS